MPAHRQSTYRVLCLLLLSVGPAAADVAPTPQPPPGRLVWLAEVTDNWDIYQRATPGGETLRLTEHPAWDWGPALSPDGGRLVWLSTRDGQEDIYLAQLTDAGLTGIERLTEDPHREGFVAWGPEDQDRLYYSALDHDGTGERGFGDLYRLGLEGGAPERLTGRPGMHYAPCWCAGRLYYACQPDSARLDYRLAELVEGEPRPVFVDGEAVRLIEYADHSPAPPRAVGGDRLAVVRLVNGEARLSVVDPRAGRLIREALIDPATVRYPRPVDADGGLFIYATAAGDDAELALGRLGDGVFDQIARLTDNAHFDGYPSWAARTGEAD
jgi:hypothetical protein